LAEVLLTLAIIGVIAAMTIPSLIAVQEKESYVAGCKKAFATLSQARMKVEQDYGGDYSALFGFTDETGGNAALQAFAPYLNIAKNCGTGTGCLPERRSDLSNPKNDWDWDADYDGFGGKAVLADGTAILILNEDHCEDVIGCGSVQVDVNGAKKPNTYGRDIFKFVIYKTKIAPEGFDLAKADINTYCSISGSGQFCATKVLREGEMNY